jgi:hypothetical protein
MTTATARQEIRPPREAAIAGLVFSFLLIIGLGIIRLGLPDVQTEQAVVNPGFGKALHLALHLVPFAGIAFLWLLGVLRQQMGAVEDKFFATIFLGSGLLFVASLFAAGAVTEAVLGGTQARSNQQVSSDVYYFARQAGYAFLNIFGIKMAGAFIFSTCTIALRTAILPRWIAFCGYACGVVLLLVISEWLWIAMLFPLWTMLVSAYILAVKRTSADRNAQAIGG